MKIDRTGHTRIPQPAPDASAEGSPGAVAAAVRAAAAECDAFSLTRLEAPPLQASRAMGAEKPLAARGGEEEVILRGDVELFSPADLEQLKGVTRIEGSLSLMWLGGGEVKLDTLQSITGALHIAGMAALELPALREVGGDMVFAANTELERVNVPTLERVGQRLEVGSLSYPLTRLTQIAFPALRSAGDVRVTAPLLTQALLPKLEHARSIEVDSNPSLERLELGSLSGVDDVLEIADSPLLPAAEVRALVDRLVASGGVDPAKVFVDAR